MLGNEILFEDLRSMGHTRAWVETLEKGQKEAFTPDSNGNLERWMKAYHSLPEIEVSGVELQGEAVTCQGSPEPRQAQALHSALRALMPWRKGPFQIFDCLIDTEWRSNLKWDRLAPHLDLRGKEILDVGCGNGYYGWRMLGAGARRVVGLDPYLLYVLQFAALRRYLGPLPHFLIPLGDGVLPPNLRAFNTVFSMGVLYHRKSPLEHLQSLGHALIKGGELILETLVIEGGPREVLIPQDRYAQMKNVWFLPTCELLERMLSRCGFEQIQVLDVAPTTIEEQRRTEWMSFDSLESFLDPRDHSLTVEGYPAPLRALIRSRKR